MKYPLIRNFGKSHKEGYGWKAASVLTTVVIVFSSISFYVFKANASALSFVCASQAATTSTAACSGEQTGDLLLVTASRTASGTAPTSPGGSWTTIGTATNSAGNASTQTALISGWSTAAGSTTASGTWTNATNVIMQVYRGQSASPIGNFATQGGSNSGTVVTYAADTLTVTDGTSWFAGFAVRNSAQALMATAPSGMTNRASSPATPVAAGHDTNGPTASNWSSTNVSGFTTAAKFTSIVIEIKASPTITVGTSGSHVSNLVVPSTGDYVGGAFTFVRDTASTNVTSITIHNNGTENAQANLSNVILFYKQEASCSVTIPAGTTQFNSTGSAFNASSDATMTGTMSVGTSQICVYVQLDVGSGATPGNTVQLQITNPSTGVVAAAGAVSPSTAVVISGSITLTPPGPTTDQVMRGGEWYSGGTKQSFFWAQ